MSSGLPSLFAGQGWQGLFGYLCVYVYARHCVCVMCASGGEHDCAAAVQTMLLRWSLLWCWSQLAVAVVLDERRGEDVGVACMQQPCAVWVLCGLLLRQGGVSAGVVARGSN